MDNVLAGLTQEAPAATGGSVTPAQVPPAADAAEVIKAYPWLGDIATGKIPVLTIPKDWRNPATKVITPQVMGALGIVFDKPKDKDFELALINPKKIKKEEFEKLDKSGKLDKFPSIAAFVPSVGANVGSDQASNAPAAGAGAGPDSASEPGPSQGKVDVVPMPPGNGFGANAQDNILKARTANLAEQVPSQRPVPGGGSILNGLLKRAV